MLDRDSPREIVWSPNGFGMARSVLLVYASGGQSQLDTWAPKPDAPSAVRGEFCSIATAALGGIDPAGAEPPAQKRFHLAVGAGGVELAG